MQRVLNYKKLFIQTTTVDPHHQSCKLGIIAIFPDILQIGKLSHRD